MKLRLHAGSLRLRLSQSEVACLANAGRVEDSVVFSPGCELRYTIETGAAGSISASFHDGNVRVTLPSPMAISWAESDESGIEESTGPLKILIEKDFQCLHRPAEPGEDSFPNPLRSSI